MSFARLVTRATFTPGAELELEAGHRRADGEADEVGLDAVGGERALEHLAPLLDRLAVEALLLERLRSLSGGSCHGPGGVDDGEAELLRLGRRRPVRGRRAPDRRALDQRRRTVGLGHLGGRLASGASDRSSAGEHRHVAGAGSTAGVVPWPDAEAVGVLGGARQRPLGRRSTRRPACIEAHRGDRIAPTSAPASADDAAAPGPRDPTSSSSAHADASRRSAATATATEHDGGAGEPMSCARPPPTAAPTMPPAPPSTAAAAVQAGDRRRGRPARDASDEEQPNDASTPSDAAAGPAGDEDDAADDERDGDARRAPAEAPSPLRERSRWPAEAEDVEVDAEARARHRRARNTQPQTSSGDGER